MDISGLIEVFKAKYKIECFRRQVPENSISNKLMILMFSESVGDIQKIFGVLETQMIRGFRTGVGKYSLNSSLMTVKNVVIGGMPLRMRSTDWMEKQISVNGMPTDYAIVYTKSMPSILLYPIPTSADNMVINGVFNFDFADPTGDPNDADYDEVFPSQYDKLIVLGMMKQLYKDLEPDYQREKTLLYSLQYNGEKFDYDPYWGEHFAPET